MLLRGVLNKVVCLLVTFDEKEKSLNLDLLLCDVYFRKCMY